jgi:NAD(P)-dependent dehydrogenase (short-subunit alcohol dehydrogenase family)
MACTKSLLDASQDIGVVMACRSPEKVDHFLQSLSQDKRRRVRVITLDLSSFSSIAQVRHQLNSEDLQLYGLVCNAGAAFMQKPQRTADGIEATFGINYLGHAALCLDLLPQLAYGARIISVASSTHDPKRMHEMPAPAFAPPADMAVRRPGAGESTEKFGKVAYTTSKLCNIMFTYALTRHLPSFKRTDVTCIAFNPGLMLDTNLYGKRNKLLQWLYNSIMPIIAMLPSPGLSYSAKSGRILAKLILDESGRVKPGEYFSLNHVTRSSDESYNQEAQKVLWEGTVALINDIKSTKI